MKFPFFFSGPKEGARGGRRADIFTPIGIVAPEDDEGDYVAPIDDNFSWDTIQPVGQPAAPSTLQATTAARAPAVDARAEISAPRAAARIAPEAARPPPGPAATRPLPETGTARATTSSSAERGPPDGSIGAILVASRRLSVADARRVVATQGDSTLPFGEAAMRLGVATAEDVQYALSQQFFMPRLQPGDPAVDPEVVAAFDTDHMIVAHLRDLRSQITRLCLDASPPLRTVAIMGIERRVGRSYVAANLATVFAQLGARTLLVDADLINPRQHLLFRLDNRAGLSSILAGRAGLGAVRPVPGLPGFAVLPAGPKPPNPHDLVARPLLAKLLRRCEQDFDIVLLDTPPWVSGNGARMVAAAAGAAVLLVAEGRTAAVGALKVSQEIAGSGSKMVGAVLNRPR